MPSWAVIDLGNAFRLIPKTMRFMGLRTKVGLNAY